MIDKKIGSYRIIERVGAGGMGVVYKAIDTSLDRPVAMKVLSSSLAENQDLVERFRVEAKAQAHLNHLNLATIYALLVHEVVIVVVRSFPNCVAVNPTSAVQFPAGAAERPGDLAGPAPYGRPPGGHDEPAPALRPDAPPRSNAVRVDASSPTTRSESHAPLVRVLIPSGTGFTVRMVDAIDSDKSAAGQLFNASVASPITVDDHTLIPKGAAARVRLEKVGGSEHSAGQTELRVRLISVAVSGSNYAVDTRLVEDKAADAGDTEKKGAFGALIGGRTGALLEKGKGAAAALFGKAKGTTTAAGAGAGEVTADQLVTHGERVRIPSDTKLDFTLSKPLEVNVVEGTR
jgi:hypothetical protein